MIAAAGLTTAVAVSQTQSHPGSTPPVPPGSIRTASGSEPGQPTAPKPATAAHLAALPEPLPPSLTQGIHVDEQAKAILAHLSEIIRFYRMTATPVQKIGEPSDVLYAEQAQTAATQISQLAFQAARDEAALLSRIRSASSQQSTVAAPGEAQKLREAQLHVQQQIQDLQAKSEELAAQLKAAKRKDRDGIEQQIQITNGQLELAKAESDALVKVSGVSTAQTNSGLQADIDKLQHAVPEVIDTKIKPVTNTVESIGSLRSSGVVTQAQALFQLLSTRRGIDERIAEVKKLHAQALELRTPLVNILRATVQQGQQLQASTNSSGGSDSNAAASASTQNGSAKKQFDQLTDAFKTIAGVSIPVSQEVLVLEQAEGNLISWRAAADTERSSIIHELLLRVVFIAIALLLVFGAGELWRRGATRYVQDIRHRRQLLVVRRLVIGFLSGLVLIFGFVTQFSSMATFAGLITAGIAVCLQTLLLSIAAYFFIIGRWGVRVGERITVAGVTGEVIDVSLVRFYLMELAGAGAQLHPTGRVAVFANSVLFQTGTPLYKQIPGTSYAWHSLAIKLKPGSDYRGAIQDVRDAVQKVYGAYKDRMERQYASTELWMDTTIPRPGIEMKMDLTDGLRFVVLYPVPFSDSASIDQQYAQSVIDLMNRDQKVAAAIDGPPTLQAVEKT
ncbi:mechanosensitive ion channel [Occallatibacter savannae]|uniref:mechanosensitive ion channel n=1 Tax=Occallatibacter savannae TaxID=1002691 RepID=UPI000D68E06A|nr:mechanosensitive ion channel [Occallatibacter savannae]